MSGGDVPMYMSMTMTTWKWGHSPMGSRNQFAVRQARGTGWELGTATRSPFGEIRSGFCGFGVAT
jgi:hypothetical protein